MSEKAITLAGTTVGTWVYDCATLRSRVIQREHKLHFKMTLSVQSPIASIIGALPFIGAALGDKAKKLSGNFSGAISVDVEAEPSRRTCDTDGKQYVGYDFVLVVQGTTVVQLAGNSLEIEATIPFAIQGEEEPCKCNAQIDPFKTSVSKLEMRTLIPISDSGGDRYAIALAPDPERLGATKSRPAMSDCDCAKPGNQVQIGDS